MSAVAFIRHMVDAGFSYEEALKAAEAFEATVQEYAPTRTKRQERNRRYYEGRRAKASETSEKRLKASYASETSDAAKKVSPKPPSKNAPSSAPKGASSPPPPDGDVGAEVWAAASRASRNRSGIPATKRAVQAALRKGASPESLLASVREHCRTSGDHAKGTHRIIEAELWREAMPKPEPPRRAMSPEFRAHCERHYAATGEWLGDPADKPKLAA